MDVKTVLGASDFYEAPFQVIKNLFSLSSILDIAIVAVLFYWFYLFLRQTRAIGILYGKHYLAVKAELVWMGVFVSLFEKKFNKLLSYYVTDMFGRYFFPAEPGEYSVVLNRKGYQKKEILAQVAPRHNIKIDVVLVKQN